MYFAGRTSDWLRVDGENFPAAPIEAIVARHPDVMLASVYGVPDVDSGDQVMAALVLRDGASFDPAAFAAWVDAQSDLSPKWRPRYVRLCKALPTTPTNKVLVRTLVHQKFRADRVGGDPVFVRGRGEDRYGPSGPTSRRRCTTPSSRAVAPRPGTCRARWTCRSPRPSNASRSRCGTGSRPTS